MPDRKAFDKLRDALDRGELTNTEALLFREYGAVFAARGVEFPTRLIFRDSDDVDAFQSRVAKTTAIIGGREFTLQTPAMSALLKAVEEASGRGLSITPRGPDSGDRRYQCTVDLWKSRVEPALDHWLSLGKLSGETAKKIRSLKPADQVDVVLRLETGGIYFAKDLSKSIIYSVAPPGASQHLSLLAFDVAEFEDASVRDLLADHCWFQTVMSDLPHFTYLGAPESDLPGLGLRAVESDGRRFWVTAV